MSPVTNPEPSSGLNGPRCSTLESIIKSHNTDVNTYWKYDTSLLMVAARRGDLASVHKLIKLGADVNTSSKCGHTALMEAARANNVPILEALLDAGADPSACDKFERTALSIATGRGHKEATLLLSSATAAFSTGTTWLYPHLSQDGLTATTITRCEKILVYEQCITSARIFAKISPEIMTHSYLSDIGINTLGTQVVLINFHRECVKAAHQKKERAALKRATAAGKLQDKRLIKTLGFIGTIASCVLLLVALCLLLKIYHIF